MTQEALAQVRYREALERRDAIWRRLIEDIEPLLTDLGELEAARKSLDEAYAELRRQGGPLPEWSEEWLALTEEWQRLIALVAPVTEAGLTGELVDSAARSPLGHAIDDLPAFLRAAARQRRKTLLQDARTRRRVALGAGASPQP